MIRHFAAFAAVIALAGCASTPRSTDAAPAATPAAADVAPDADRKAILMAWQKRKQKQLVHPFLNERVTVGLVVHLQARLLARHIRGDADVYPAFIWK